MLSALQHFYSNASKLEKKINFKFENTFWIFTLSNIYK